MSNNANSDENTLHIAFKTADEQIRQIDYEIEPGSPNVFFGIENDGRPLCISDLARFPVPSVSKEVEHFSSFDTDALNKALYDYGSLDLANATLEDIEKGLKQIFMPQGIFYHFPFIAGLKEGTTLFRARRLHPDEDGMCTLTEHDFWEPSEPLVKNYGRLNVIGESVLYTNFANPWTVHKEINITPGDDFLLIAYQSIADFEFEQIGLNDPHHAEHLKGLSDHAYQTYMTINSFLESEFTRVVPDGSEAIYRSTNTILKTYFGSHKIWAYPSIKGCPGLNICFSKDKAHKLLEIQGAAICNMDKLGNIDFKLSFLHRYNDEGHALFCDTRHSEQPFIMPGKLEVPNAPDNAVDGGSDAVWIYRPKEYQPGIS